MWRQRDALMADKTAIDVAQLERVDSAGLALLLHLQEEQRARRSAKIFGATERLKTLIALYNLQAIIPVDTAV